MIFTRWPSPTSSWASAAPTRPQPRMTMFMRLLLWHQPETRHCALGSASKRDWEQRQRHYSTLAPPHSHERAAPSGAGSRERTPSCRNDKSARASLICFGEDGPLAGGPPTMEADTRPAGLLQRQATDCRLRLRLDLRLALAVATPPSFDEAEPLAVRHDLAKLA